MNGYGETCGCQPIALLFVFTSFSPSSHSWALFPPNTPKELVAVRKEDGGSQKDEAVVWFSVVYPRTQQPSWPRDHQPVSNG